MKGSIKLKLIIEFIKGGMGHATLNYSSNNYKHVLSFAGLKFGHFFKILICWFDLALLKLFNQWFKTTQLSINFYLWLWTLIYAPLSEDPWLDPIYVKIV